MNYEIKLDEENTTRIIKSYYATYEDMPNVSVELITEQSTEGYGVDEHTEAKTKVKITDSITIEGMEAKYETFLTNEQLKQIFSVVLNGKGMEVTSVVFQNELKYGTHYNDRYVSGAKFLGTKITVAKPKNEFGLKKRLREEE